MRACFVLCQYESVLRYHLWVPSLGYASWVHKGIGEVLGSSQATWKTAIAYALVRARPGSSCGRPPPQGLVPGFRAGLKVLCREKVYSGFRCLTLEVSSKMKSNLWGRPEWEGPYLDMFLHGNGVRFPARVPPPPHPLLLHAVGVAFGRKEGRMASNSSP